MCAPRSTVLYLHFLGIDYSMLADGFLQTRQTLENLPLLPMALLPIQLLNRLQTNQRRSGGIGRAARAAQIWDKGANLGVSLLDI